MTEYRELDACFITERFPELREQVGRIADGPDGFLPHVVFGDVFNGRTAALLKQDDYRTNSTLIRIFEMYEELAVDGDEDVRNLVQVTLLEYLWDEKITFDRAAELIGERTRGLWDGITWLKEPIK